MVLRGFDIFSIVRQPVEQTSNGRVVLAVLDVIMPMQHHYNVVLPYAGYQCHKRLWVLARR